MTPARWRVGALLGLTLAAACATSRPPGSSGAGGPRGPILPAFERRVAPFPVSDADGTPYPFPLLGGFNVPRPQLVDIDGVRVVRVDDLASELGLSARQLHRRCLHAFGYGPKTLARVVRFQHFLHAARAAPTLSFARLAAECGYSDESHLSHDCRALGGVPPGELVRRDT